MSLIEPSRINGFYSKCAAAAANDVLIFPVGPLDERRVHFID